MVRAKKNERYNRCLPGLGMSLVGPALTGKATLENMTKTMRISWQRLVDDTGETCDRCGATEKAVESAAAKLSRALANLDIDVKLNKDVLSAATFAADPLQSNRIWINDIPLETWLSATIGQSQCCSACGDSDCRTMIVDGHTFEAIPPELIIKAGLLAGAQLLDIEPGNTCCSGTEHLKQLSEGSPPSRTPGGSKDL